MSTVTVKLEPEDVDLLLETYAARLAAAEAAVFDLRQRIQRLQALAAKPDQAHEPPVIVARMAAEIAERPGVVEKTEKGRVPRGQTRKLVENFLRARNVVGATITETAGATGTKYPTVRRIIKELQEIDAVHEGKESHWHWGSRLVDLSGMKDAGAGASP